MEQSVFKTVEDLQKAAHEVEDSRKGAGWTAQDFKVLQQLCSKVTDSNWTSKNCPKFCQDFEALTHKLRSAEAISKRLRIQYRQETDEVAATHTEVDLEGLAALRLLAEKKLVTRADAEAILQKVVKVNFGDLA